MSTLNQQQVHSNLDLVNNQDQNQVDTITATTENHCNHPGMNCVDDMQSTDCNSACCNHCLGASATLTSFPFLSISHPLQVKPVSGDTTFYTHIISPELRPPLV